MVKRFQILITMECQLKELWMNVTKDSIRDLHFSMLLTSCYGIYILAAKILIYVWQLVLQMVISMNTQRKGRNSKDIIKNGENHENF